MPGSQMDIEIIEERSTRNKLLQLPVARIKTIMKSSPDLGNVNNEGVFAVAKAAELFVSYFAEKAYEEAKDQDKLDYNALSTVVRKDECLEFLEEIVPKKIKVSEYWKMIGHDSNEEKKGKKNENERENVDADDENENDGVDVELNGVKNSPSLKSPSLKSPSLKSPGNRNSLPPDTIVID